MASNGEISARRLRNPLLFICDLQDKFRPAIAHFPAVLATTQKLLRASAALHIPVLATTQSRAKLGETCPELGLDAPSGGVATLAHVDKTAFSMLVPGVLEAMETIAQEKDGEPFDCIVVGIETHICVLQTSLDLLSGGHRVWVVQDAVSSCNEEERAVALARLRQEGARVTTSESLLYEIMGDAGDSAFRDIAKIVKETKDSTKESLRALCKI